MGESILSAPTDKTDRIAVDTVAGKVHVEWDPTAAVTPMGQLAFFIDFLKTGRIYEPWVADFPLRYTSPNAPEKRDILLDSPSVRSCRPPSIFTHDECPER